MFICKENYDYAETQHGTGTTGCLTNSFSLLSLLVKHDLRGRRVGFNAPSSNMLRVTLPYLQDQRESLMVLNQSQWTIPLCWSYFRVGMLDCLLSMWSTIPL